jgi:hypothetical protein
MNTGELAPTMPRQSVVPVPRQCFSNRHATRAKQSVSRPPPGSEAMNEGNSVRFDAPRLRPAVSGTGNRGHAPPARGHFRSAKAAKAAKATEPARIGPNG